MSAPYDLAWFQASAYGASFPNATASQIDFISPLAEAELMNIKCYCPDLYDSAMTIQVALMLEGMGLGHVAGALPTTTTPGGTETAYLVEDDVFDVKRKYNLKPKQAIVANSNAAGILQGMIDRCKAPITIGATLARSVGGMFGGCCGNDTLGQWPYYGRQ